MTTIPTFWGAQDIVYKGPPVAAIGLANNVVAALPNGGYVAGFVSGNALYFQRYDGAGAKVGAPTLVSAQGTPDGYDVKVVSDDGRYVISWNELGETSSSIRSQVYDINGSPIGAANQVAVFADDSGSDAPSVIRKSGGGFVTVFNSPETGGGVRLAVQNADGSVASTHNITIGAGRRGDVTEIAPNKYLVSYNYTTAAGAHTVGVYYAILDLSGNAPVLNQEVRVGGGSSSVSDAIALKDAGGNPAGFAVLCNTLRVLTLHRYDNNGTAAATVEITRLGEDFDNQEDFFNLTALRDGRIAVVYSAADGTDRGNIFLRIIKSDGTFDGDPLPLDTTRDTDGNSAQLTPSISEMADGRLSVTWHDRTSSNGHIVTTIIDARVSPVTVNGTHGDDIYAGSSSNGNVLNGNSGNDKFFAGSGSDAFHGGAGFDTVTYERSAGRVIVNLAANSGAGGDAEGDTFTEIEKVFGSNHGDLFTGDDTANEFDGLAGNDTLAGGGGVDVLYGNVGNDTLYGNADADRLLGGDGNDALDGGEGADWLEGGNGNDTYYVDDTDTIVEAAGGGIDTVYTSGNVDLTRFANIENIVFTGLGPATMIGNGDNNTLTGGVSNDTIQGGGGDDAVSGGAGNDGLDGGLGNDVLDGGDGNDNLLGGDGNDVLYGGNGLDYMEGNAGNDILYGGADNDFLKGDAGNDTLFGEAGNDTLHGGADNDALSGDDGNDILFGDAGNDNLDGGAGNDQIWGGLGKDVLKGGAGKDVFVFDYRANKAHADRVMDFSVRDDSIYLENKYFSKLGKKGSLDKPAKIASKFFKVGTKAQDRDDYLIYNKKTGKLYYDENGSGAGKMVEIATLSKNLKLKYSDFFLI